jgi:hypothetical protein
MRFDSRIDAAADAFANVARHTGRAIVHHDEIVQPLVMGFR